MSISSVITGGFGTPGSAALVITDGYATVGAVPPPVVTPTGGGGGKRKRKRNIVRYSDLEKRDDLERALSRQWPVIAPTVTPDPIPIEDDEEDEEVVINALMLLH